jgi:DnaJ homologue, subfamily C, member 28, conserved domain
MTERKPPGMSFETWVDQQINQARSRGAFDGLAGAGRPLPRRAREQTSYDWALEWARRENGGVVEGMLPPGLALRKERDELPGVVQRLPSEAAVRELVAAFNARVEALWRRPMDPPDVVAGLADLDALLAHWRANRPPPPAVVPEPPAPPRRRWFRRRAG